MISRHFSRMFTVPCDDDGVYYVRQVDEDDGVRDFEGIVWFGQQMQGEPSFANVFMGRLRSGVHTDSHGEPVDVWEGRFFDVPKGRTCGIDDLTLESFVVPPVPVAACDFPEHYLVKARPSLFGGRVWGLAIAGCWHEAFEVGDVTVRPPRVGPLISSAIRTGSSSIMEEVDDLGSGPAAVGFEGTGTDLTGTWRGDDNGSYYVTHATSTGEVVWYAEHPNAHPTVSRERPARAWANVFFGQQSGSRISGMWADVPRGAGDNAEHLELAVESPHTLQIVSATGSYGGRRLGRVRTRQVVVRVPELRIERTQESRDEPLLYLAFFKLDGDTVNLDDLSSSLATVEVRPELRLGPNVAGNVAIPVDPGTFETTLSTVHSSSAVGIEAATRIGVIAYAIEVDSGYSREFRENRFNTWGNGQRHGLTSSLRRGELPTLEFIRGRASRILVRYLGPWEGWPWGDPDDTLSGDAAMVTFGDFERTARIERLLQFSGDGGRYEVPVIFESRSRINRDCR